MATIDSFQYLHDEIIRNLNSINDLLAFYGAWHLIRNLARSTKALRILYRFSKRIDIRNFGKYAVISSIENELGREIALYLAGQGVNLILIIDSKNDEMNEFLTSLSTNFKIEILTLNLKILNECSNSANQTDRKDQNVKIDLKDKQGQMIENSKSDDENEIKTENPSANDIKSDQEDLLEKIMQKDIGIFINCNDYRPKRWNKFLTCSDQEIDQVIHTNILLPVKMHRLFVKKLVVRENGLILNVSSSVAMRPWPYLSLYSSSKCFIDQFSSSLDNEYSKKEKLLFKTLILTHLTSHLFKKTEIHNQITQQQNDQTIQQFQDQHHQTEQIDHKISSKNRLINLLLPTKSKFIHDLLASGYSCSTTGHWLFALEYYLIDSLPQYFLNFGLEYLLSRRLNSM